MHNYICPSLMCANFGNLSREVEELENADVDIFHVDVMDGVYVDNFGMGVQDISFICQKSDLPVEAHLMIMSPERHLSTFVNLGIQILYFHPETCVHPVHLIQELHRMGIKAGIVLSPETSIESVRELLPVVDYAMVMMVNPGFAGNTYLGYIEDKVRRLCDIKDLYQIEIAIDGGCTKQVINRLSSYGANRFVLGSTGLFNGKDTYKNLVSDLKK